jgi:hypothetical protein
MNGENRRICVMRTRTSRWLKMPHSRPRYCEGAWARFRWKAELQPSTWYTAQIKAQGARTYLSSQMSSNLQPLKLLLTMIVSPFT